MPRSGNRYPHIIHWRDVRLGDIEMLMTATKCGLYCTLKFVFNVEYLIFFMLVFVVCINRLMLTYMCPIMYNEFVKEVIDGVGHGFTTDM